MTHAALGPAAAGVRVAYDDLPAPVRSWVETQLRTTVVGAVTQPGGFSPGVAARLVGADGTRAFVKAVSAEVNADSRMLHRREAQVLGSLPAGLPVPRLLAVLDDGPWIALLVEDVDGVHPQLPWRDDELALLLDALRAVADAVVTGLPTLGEQVDGWRGWRGLLADDGHGLDGWTLRHLERLAALEAQVRDALPPTCLQHGDARADNTLLRDGRAWLVDWPWAGLAPWWFDVVALAPCVLMQGGPDPEELLARSRLVPATDAEAVTVVVAAVAGFLLSRSRLPPPPGIPTVRAFQAAQAEIAVRWLAQRTGWR